MVAVLIIILDATEVLLGEFDVKRGSIEADLKRMEQELSSLVEEHLQTMVSA